METHILLKNLIGVTLDSIERNKLSIQRLLEASQASLKDAQVKELSNEGRFDLAYKSITQASSAALQAHGYRVLTSKPGHHQTIIQSLVHTMGVDTSTLITLDQLRKQRNVIDYSGDIVSNAMLDEAIKQAQALLSRVNKWITVNGADFLVWLQESRVDEPDPRHWQCWVWLLRSRPDQVVQTTMRGGPSNSILAC